MIGCIAVDGMGMGLQNALGIVVDGLGMGLWNDVEQGLWWTLGMQLVDAGWLAARGMVRQLSALLECCGFGMQLGFEGFAWDCH